MKKSRYTYSFLHAICPILTLVVLTLAIPLSPAEATPYDNYVNAELERTQALNALKTAAETGTPDERKTALQKALNADDKAIKAKDELNQSAAAPAAPATPAATPAAQPATPATPAAQSQQPGQPAFAAPTNSGLGETIKGVGTTPLLIIGGALWVIRSILSYILDGVGALLDQMLFANTNFNPANMPAIQLGWAVVRDLANSLFILLILWIAFTIIFNREEWGGKNLLIRVIVVALLINFSLVFVTAVFGFTNLLADVFSKNLPRDSRGALVVSGFLVDKLKIMTLFQQPTTNEIRQLTEAEKNNNFGYSTTKEGKPINYTYNNTGFKNTLLASIGVQTTHAEGAGGAALGAAGGFATGCALGLFAFGVGCAVTGTIGALAGALLGYSSFDAYTLAVREGITAVFLLLTATAFLLAGMFLLFRLIAMIILSILAPAAIFLHAVPGKKYGKEYWDKWINALIRWAFFAPIFYFLLYISLFMLDKFDEQNKAFAGINITANTNYFVVLLATLSFIVAAIMITRKTAGAIAETAIGYGKQFAGYAAGGIAGAGALGAGMAARRFAPAIEKGLGRVAQTPVIGKATAPFARRVQGYLDKERGKIDEHKKQIAGFSAEGRVGEFRRSVSAERKLAAAEALIDSDDFDKLNNKEQAQVLKFASTFGRERQVIKAVPHLATPEIAKKLIGDDPQGAKWKNVMDESRKAGGSEEDVTKRAAIMVAVRRIKNPADMKTVVSQAVEDARFREAVLIEGTTQHLNVLYTQNTVAAIKLKDELFVEKPRIDPLTGQPKLMTLFEALPEKQRDMYDKYFSSAPLGRALEPHWERRSRGRRDTFIH